MIFYRIHKTTEGFQITSKSYPGVVLIGDDKIETLRQFIKQNKPR